jgi:thioredoxin 1
LRGCHCGSAIRRCAAQDDPAIGSIEADRADFSATMTAYAEAEPTRAAVDALQGPTLLEFCSPTCGHCRRAQPLIASALAAHPRVRHLKIADARGRPLGRSFGVKLWPTLVLLAGGKEVARLVRPVDAGDIGKALAAIHPAP